jgi:hypothetical protein
MHMSVRSSTPQNELDAAQLPGDILPQEYKQLFIKSFDVSQIAFPLLALCPENIWNTTFIERTLAHNAKRKMCGLITSG